MANFKDFFQNSSMNLQTIRELYSFAEDKYEKIMAVCMILALAAVFNPIMLMFFAFGHADSTVRITRLCFLVVMLAFLIISLYKGKSFRLSGLLTISALKIYPFPESMSDTLFAAAFIAFAYLVFRIKRDKDGENP